MRWQRTRFGWLGWSELLRPPFNRMRLYGEPGSFQKMRPNPAFNTDSNRRAFGRPDRAG